MSTKLNRVIIQVERPTSTYEGRVEEGFYQIDDDVVTLCSAAGLPLHDRKGKPFEDKLATGEYPQWVAARLLRKHYQSRHSNADFKRPLQYQKINY